MHVRVIDLSTSMQSIFNILIINALFPFPGPHLQESINVQILNCKLN